MTTENQPARMGDAYLAQAFRDLARTIREKADHVADYGISGMKGKAILDSWAEMIESLSPSLPAREISAHGGDGGGDDDDIVKCYECGAIMDIVRPGKYQHPECSQSPAFATQQPASGEVSTPKLIRILKDYRCIRQQLDDNGGGLPLVDALTPAWAKNIADGLAEIEMLADHIAGEITTPATAAHGGSGEGKCCRNAGTFACDCNTFKAPPTSASEAEVEAVDENEIMQMAFEIGGTDDGNYYFTEEELQEFAAKLLARSPARVGGDWRLLTRADAIEGTDQILHDDTVTWISPPRWVIGMQYDPSLHVPARRAITQQATP